MTGFKDQKLLPNIIKLFVLKRNVQSVTECITILKICRLSMNEYSTNLICCPDKTE